ncbi:MAG: hypothetical protein IPK74_39695 [Deltaproteobacteria bacterium]|nr:hypothetical protein [Deltaproteobacteria bacterium]
MLLGLSVAPTGVVGCAKGVLNDQTVDSWGTIGSAEDTGSMPVMDGTLWCARMPAHPDAPVGTQGPRYCKSNGTVDPWVCGEDNEGQIIEPQPDGGAPKGCVCVPPEVQADYAVDHIIGDDETPGGILTLYRDEIYAAAVTRCLEVIDETPGANHNECENIIGPALDADLIPEHVQSGGIGSCVAFQIYAPDTTGGADSTTAGFDVDPGVAAPRRQLHRSLRPQPGDHVELGQEPVRRGRRLLRGHARQPRLAAAGVSAGGHGHRHQLDLDRRQRGHGGLCPRSAHR